eukprot:865651_1
MDNDTRNFLEGIAFDEALIKKFAEAGMIMNTFLFASADELNEICGALEVPLLKGITFKTAVRSLQATRVLPGISHSIPFTDKHSVIILNTHHTHNTYFIAIASSFALNQHNTLYLSLPHHSHESFA